MKNEKYHYTVRDKKEVNGSHIWECQPHIWKLLEGGGAKLSMCCPNVPMKEAAIAPLATLPAV